MEEQDQITVNFANVPSDVALALARTNMSEELAEDMARALGLGFEDMRMFHDALIGGIAQTIDAYMGWKK